MYKKIAVFAILFFIGFAVIYANRGSSLTFKALDYRTSDEVFAPQSFIKDLKKSLCSYYSVKVAHSEVRVIKYDWKKFLYFENVFTVRKQDMSVELCVDIQQQQPYLLHRKKNHDYYIYFTFIDYVDGYEREDDDIAFGEDVVDKVELFAKKYNLETYDAIWEWLKENPKRLWR